MTVTTMLLLALKGAYRGVGRKEKKRTTKLCVNAFQVILWSNHNIM